MKDRTTNCLTLHIIGTALEFLNKFSLISDLPCENLIWPRAVKRSRSPVFDTEKIPGVANPPRSNNLQNSSQEKFMTTRVGWWYATGPADQEYYPSHPSFSLHTVCHAALKSRNHACLFFNPFLGFNCIVTALKSRTVALKTRTKFLVKFVRDISTKVTLSFFRPSASVRDLSTSRSTNSGI